MNKKFAIIGLLIFIFFSCKHRDIQHTLPMRTVIVYMIADNNLSYFADGNINDMEKIWDTHFDGHLIVYVDRASGASVALPMIYEIQHDITDTIKSKIIKVYPEQNSADAQSMNNVLQYIIGQYPAQSYGLVLWSHGTGWYPANTFINNTTISSNIATTSQIKINGKILPLTKSFGKDGSNEINISDLKNALPRKFDFILFDACYMGSIEVVYSLKNKTDYIIASPAETISTGFPYTQIIPCMFTNPIDYQQIATSFYTAYDTLEGSLQSATVSVIKTDALDKLAQSVSALMQNTTNLQIADYTQIQQLSSGQKGFFFDMQNAITHQLKDTNIQEFQNFKNALNTAVLYKMATPHILNTLDILKFSGLSMFVPNSLTTKNNNFYKQYEWYIQSGYHFYFDTFNIQ